MIRRNSRARLDSLVIVFAFLAFLTATDSVNGQDIKVLSGDSPVKINGTIGDDTTFVKRFGVISSAAVPELILRSTDLVSGTGKESIGRQQVAPTGQAKIDLAANTPKDIEIKVTGVKLPASIRVRSTCCCRGMAFGHRRTCR